MKPNYLFKQEDLLAKTEQAESEDELFFEACQFVVEQGERPSSVQRKFRIGYNRAARLIEEMQSQGIISEARGRSQEMSLFLRMNSLLCRKRMYSPRFCCILIENVG